MRVFTSAVVGAVLCAAAIAAPGFSLAQSDVPQPPPAAFPDRDGSHDFDFLIGSWKAHVRVLRNRLNHSTSADDWVTYDGTSIHRKLLDSNANFEEFDVYSAQLHRRIKAQTLRLYNPATREWTIVPLDLDEGTLGLPAVIGHFTGKRGEFYNQDTFKGRPILTRYVWLDVSPHEARMEQAFSADGGKSWEVNWICDLTR